MKCCIVSGIFSQWAQWPVGCFFNFILILVDTQYCAEFYSGDNALFVWYVVEAQFERVWYWGLEHLIVLGLLWFEVRLLRLQKCRVVYMALYVWLRVSVGGSCVEIRVVACFASLSAISLPSIPTRLGIHVNTTCCVLCFSDSWVSRPLWYGAFWGLDARYWRVRIGECESVSMTHGWLLLWWYDCKYFCAEFTACISAE